MGSTILRIRLFLLATTIAAGLVSADAQACLVVGRMTTQAMVDAAEDVILVRAMSKRVVVYSACGEPLYDDVSVNATNAQLAAIAPSLRQRISCILSSDQSVFIEMEVQEVLKGDFHTKGETIRVLASSDREFVRRTKLSIPYRGRRPGGTGCSAYSYRAGELYLLFLRGHRVYLFPLLPCNEEVSGLADPWLLWTREALKRPGPSVDAGAPR